MNPNPVNRRLFALGWTPSRLARATGYSIQQISQIINGHRRTQDIQLEILNAVRYGCPEFKIQGHWEETGTKLFGALWWACTDASVA